MSDNDFLIKCSSRYSLLISKTHPHYKVWVQHICPTEYSKQMSLLVCLIIVASMQEVKGGTSNWQDPVREFKTSSSAAKGQGFYQNRNKIREWTGKHWWEQVRTLQWEQKSLCYFNWQCPDWQCMLALNEKWVKSAILLHILSWIINMYTEISVTSLLWNHL